MSSSSDSEYDSSESESVVTSHADHKEEGNENYKSGDYRSAIHQYSLAIDTASKLLQVGEKDNQDDTDAITEQTLASYHSNRAAASTMILRFDDALFDCERAIELDPTFLKARVRMARILTTVGRLKEASVAYARAMIYDPNDSNLVKACENVKTLQKRFELLRDLLNDGNGDNGDDPMNRREEVQCRQQQQRLQVYPYLTMPPIKYSKQALNQIKLILSSSPEWNELLLYKVRALVYSHNIKEAYALTTSLIRRSSSGGGGEMGSDSALLLLRAHCLFCMGNLNDAVKHARQVLTRDPDHRDAFAMHKLFKGLGKKKEEADGAYKTRNFEESVDLYTQALELCPGRTGATGGGLYRAKLYFNRASALSNLRKHSEVVADCTRALRLDSEYIKAYTRRASSNLLIVDDDGAEARCQTAINDYKKALELSSTGVSKNEATIEELKKKIRAANVQLKRCKQKDFYKILNVARDASDAEIKKSYRKAALKWHPDRHSNSSDEEKKKAEKTFRDVNLAYEILSDSEKKRKYDSGVDEQDLDNPHAGNSNFQHGGIDPQVLFQMFMQQNSGGGGRGASFSFG